MTKLTIRALLIEDNPADAMFVQEALARDASAQFDLTLAERLSDGLALAQQQPFDVLLLDLGLPDSSGLATFDQVRRRVPDLPVVVLSGMVDEQVAVDAVQAGAQDYLVKGPAGWDALPRASRYAIERQQARAALRASAEQLRMANEAADLGTWRQDLIGGQISLDARSQTHFGAARPVVGAQELGALVHPDDRELLQHLTGKHGAPSSDDGLFALEYRVIHPNSAVHWLAVHARVHYEGAGAQIRPAFVVGTSQDITARKQAEARDRASAARLQVLADASRAFAEAGNDYQAVLEHVTRHASETLGDRCAIGLLSEDGERLRVAALQGVEPEARAAISALLEEMPLRDQPLAYQVIAHAKPILIRNLDLPQVRATLPSPIGQLMDQMPYHSAIMVPLCVQRRAIGMLYLSRYRAEQPPFDDHDLQLAHDLADRAALAIENARLFERAQIELAERERAEQALQQERALLASRVAERTAELTIANAELARAARLKDEFLASMSHELRTPLNSILGRTQALQEEIYGELAPRQSESLRGIEESGRHLLTLINDILDLSKIEADKLAIELEAVDVELLCRVCLRMVAQTALTKQIAVSSTLDTHVEVVDADERRLKQILVNLLSNAVKFTPAGGRIGLEVRGDAARETVTFTVWDTGIGIAPDDLSRLFQPFMQIDSSLSRQYEGTGLGLALVRRLAEAHGGSVGVESVPGQGSRFSVVLPWSAAAPAYAPPLALAPAAPAPVRLAAPGPLGRPRILLAEDNPANIDLLRDYLDLHGYAVSVALNGAEALDHALAALPDAILMDIQMPVMDGLEAIQRIRADARLRNTPIIALTALTMPGDRERCLQAGADEYMAKPISLRTLLATLEQRLRRGASQPASAAREAP